jgi:hypothetical protein
MLASALSVLLMGGVLFSLSALSRDAAAVIAKDPSQDLKGMPDLLQWDLGNARSVSQSADHRTLVLVGHGGIRPDTLRPNGRLARVVYSCELRGKLWRMTRGQRYLDDPARPQAWTDLVALGVSSVEVLPAAGATAPGAPPGSEERGGTMPQWVRLRIYGQGVALEKQVCIK